MNFYEFAQDRGLIIDHLVIGKICRTKTVDHPYKKNGAYYFESDFGWCQNWAQDTEISLWRDQKERSVDDKEKLEKRMAASRNRYAQDRSDKQAKAVDKARWILSQCELDKHAYLDGKGFKEMLGNVWRVGDNQPILVIPMFYAGKICGAQCISVDGSKKFLFGQRTNDAYFKIGQTGREIISEGYATALSINAILTAAKIPATIYATFSVGNAARIAKTHPKALWIADNDVSGVGQNAAAASGLQWWMPPTPGADANDWHKEVGLFKASMILKNVLLSK